MTAIVATCETCGVLMTGTRRYAAVVIERADNHITATGHTVRTEIQPDPVTS